MKADLDKPDDDVFCDAIGNALLVREAKNFNRVHNLFNVICQKLCKSIDFMITKSEFRTLVHAFIRLTDTQTNEMFGHLTKKASTKSSHNNENIDGN